MKGMLSNEDILPQVEQLSFIVITSLANDYSSKKLLMWIHTEYFYQNSCLRPYHVENTSSRLITEVKQH